MKNMLAAATQDILDQWVTYDEEDIERMERSQQELEEYKNSVRSLPFHPFSPLLLLPASTGQEIRHRMAVRPQRGELQNTRPTRKRLKSFMKES